MSNQSRLFSRLWMVALLCACVFIIALDVRRARRVEHVTGLAGGVVPVSKASPTGYAGGVRRLVVPDHNFESYQWIAQTQQMLAQGEWRVRHVDYDNAPQGREVQLASPYRWWLGFMSWLDRLGSTRSVGGSVEQAAVWAGPVLRVLVVVASTLLAWRALGGIAALVAALGMAGLFPLAAEFLPGQPRDAGLELTAALWSLMLLAGGVRRRLEHGGAASAAVDDAAARRAARWFFVAGIAGGFGAWINVASQVPLVIGVALGGIAAGVATRRDNLGASLPWRAWAWGGASMSVFGWLVEYFPSHLSALGLEANHPVYALGWLALGEVVHVSAKWLRDARRPRGRGLIVFVVAATVFVSVAGLVLMRGRGALWTAAVSSQLTTGISGIVAENLGQWMLRDGISGALFAAGLPVLVLGGAVWLIARRDGDAWSRYATALLGVPALLLFAIACTRLEWWTLLQAALLGLLLVLAANAGRVTAVLRWSVAGVVAASVVAGAMLQVSRTFGEKIDVVSESDVEALIERDLAHWLANRSANAGAVVYAPPGLSAALAHFGGLRAIGSPYVENKDGFAAAVRIAGTASMDEAQVLMQRRQVRFVVVPSWDTYLDEYTRLGAEKPEKALVPQLHQWLPPRWLRPVAYRLPNIPGFEGRSVVVFELVEPQDNATALSHLAEYFLEMEMLVHATSVADALQANFPDDLNGLIARAHVRQARGEALAVREILSGITQQIERGEDRALPWERAVSLAVVLAEAKRFEAAREQVRRSLEEIDEARVRSLSTLALFRLQVLAKAFDLEIADPQVRELARGLVPPELRDRI